MLDVNAGIPLADEPAILARTIQLVQSLTDLPLSIDSSIVEALEAGLAVYQGKALVNSVTGEDERLERVLPLVRKYGAAVVAISNDETGISRGPRRPVRGREADRGARRRPRDPARGRRRRPAAHADRGDADRRPAGLPDPQPAARRARASTRTCGASNVSFGLPNREGINGAFLAMAIASGLTSRDHQPAPGRGAPGGHGRRRADGQRPRVRPLDPDLPRAARPRARPGRRVNRRRGGRAPDAAAGAAVRARRADQRRPTSRSSIFTPSGRRGRFARRHDRPRRGPRARRRHRLGVRRPRHLRPLPGQPGHRRVPEARDHLAGRPPLGARRRSRPTYRARRTAWPPTGGWAARRASWATSLIDVPPESQVHRQVVRKGLERARLRDRPGRPAPLRRGRAARAGLARPATSPGSSRRLEREWGLTGLDGRPRGDPRAPAGARGGRRTG